MNAKPPPTRTRLYEMLGATFSDDATEGRGVIRALLNCRGDIRVQSDRSRSIWSNSVHRDTPSRCNRCVTS
jgi:hypothetical protein